MPPFEMVADTERSILRTYFRGVVTAEALAVEVHRAEKVILAMRPGFTVAADLSALEEMDLDCVPHLARLMDAFQQAGVARVVRLIPDGSKDIGFTLLSHTHYRGRVPFRTVANVEELNDALAD